MAGREGGGGGLAALAMSQNDHGARTAREVASTDGHGQPGRIINIAIAIALDIGAVVIVVSMWLAGALGPPARRRHDRRRGHTHPCSNSPAGTVEH